MQQVNRYFIDKKQSYKLFFLQLLRVIDSLRRDCQKSIDLQYNHMLSQIRMIDSQQINQIINHLQSRRQLHFQSIVQLLIRVLSNMPKNIVKNNVSIIDNTPFDKNIPPSPSQIAVNTTTNRVIHPVQQGQRHMYYKQQVIQSTEQKVPLILSASKKSSERRNSSHSKNLDTYRNSQDIAFPMSGNGYSSKKGYSINKMNPVVFQLSSSENNPNLTERKKQIIQKKIQFNRTQAIRKEKMELEMLETDSNKQKNNQIQKLEESSNRKESNSSQQVRDVEIRQHSISLGISEGNSSSLLKVMTLLKNDKEQSPNYKVCLQLDNRIYAQANDYLNGCFTKKYNKIINSSRKNLYRGGEESPISKLQDCKNFDSLQTRGFNQQIRKDEDGLDLVKQENNNV